MKIKIFVCALALVSLASFCLVSCGPSAQPEAKAAMVLFFNSAQNDDFKTQAEMIDPVIFGEIAKMRNKTPDQIKEMFVTNMKKNNSIKLLSYTIGDQVKISDTKIGFVITESIKDKNGERSVIETWYSVKSGNDWKIRPPEQGK